jgi:hypothetical protein
MTARDSIDPAEAGRSRGGLNWNWSLGRDRLMVRGGVSMGAMLFVIVVRRGRLDCR